jgi:hypothetical protein
MSIKEPFMAFEVSPNRSNASITVSSEASHKPGGIRRAAQMQAFNDQADVRISLENHSDAADDTTLIRWIPVFAPLAALLPTLAAFFIGWSVLTGTH